MIYGPQYNPNIRRVQPVDPDRQDEPKDGRRRRVEHLGRAWEETDHNDLPLQPSIPQTPSPTRTQQVTAGVYADQVLLEKAHAFFSQLTTIEEKAAQLCFLMTESIYDASMQQAAELLIQTWQIGGILFHKGDYRRQAYLIERYQEVSKTPLLMANDYLHGLSFYFQGDVFPKHFIQEQHFTDLGKAVMVQNRRLGVQIQFDRERQRDKFVMDERQAKAFRKGIRGAHGIVGKEKAERQQESYAHSIKNPFSLHGLTEKPFSAFTEYQVQETIGFKTLTFYDATLLDKEILEQELFHAFKQLYDVILLAQQNCVEGIRMIARLVRSNKIKEEVLDRHVLKALIIKSLFF
jgi:hypothetical protein